MIEAITKVQNIISLIRNKTLPDRLYGYKQHLQLNVLKLNKLEFDNFINLLRSCNVYIVGHSLFYYILGLSEYNNKLDLFINISNLKLFLDNIYIQFIPISLKLTSKYSTLNENIIEVVYNLKYNVTNIEIILHIFYNINIDDYIKTKLSIFGLWWVPYLDDNIYINNVAEQFIVTNKLTSITYLKLPNLNLSQDEESFLETKKIFAQYKNIEPIPYTNKTNFETLIVKLLVSNLSKYLFILTEETNDIRIYNTHSFNLIDSFNENYIFQYNTGENIINKYKILSSLDLILYMYNNIPVINPNLYTYNLFYKAYIKFCILFEIDMEIIYYIDKVITEEILNKYNIKINIDGKNKIKFNFSNIQDSSKLNKNDEIYVKQVLLFYYKKKIYKVKSNYKVINLITNDDKYLEINFNIYTDTSTEKINNYHKLLKNGNKDITYIEIISGLDITDIEEYITEENDNIILVEPGILTVTCISKQDLDKTINNIKDNWFYDCSKFNSNYLSNPYIKIPTMSNSYYIHYKYIYSLFKSKNKLFYINPTNTIIEKTASYKNTPIGQKIGIENAVSSNNCQNDTDIVLSTISSIFIPSETLPETSYDSRKITTISFNKSYPISLK